MKNLYIVLGLPRSGTSAITRALQALGVGLGNHFKAPKETNPKGCWEDVDIMYGINRTAKRIKKTTIITAECLQENSEAGKQLRKLQVSAELLLQERFGNESQWGFKDLRTGEMLPFWLEVFDRMNLKQNYILAFRHPLSCAYSNQSFNHYDVEQALIYWLDYMIRVIDQTHGKNRVAVSYELMLQQPIQQLEHIRSSLGITLTRDEAAIEFYSNEFLDKKLRHHQFSDNDLMQQPVMAVSPLCVEVYNLLLRSAKGELSLNDEAFHAEWHKIKVAYEQVKPIYQYVGKVLYDKKNLERKVRTIHKSLPWKIIYPLRLIDDFLRKKRLARREQNNEFKKRSSCSA